MDCANNNLKHTVFIHIPTTMKSSGGVNSTLTKKPTLDTFALPPCGDHTKSKTQNIHSTDLFDFLCDLVYAVGIFLGLLHTQAGVLDLVAEECDISL